MNMNPVIERVIEKAINKEREELKLSVQYLSDNNVFFGPLLKLGEAQEKEYEDLFNVPGHLPKHFGKIFAALFENYDTEPPPSSFVWNVKTVQDCIDLAAVLDRDLNNNPVVLVRAKVTGDLFSKEERQYRICHINTIWNSQEGFKPRDGINFSITQIPKSTTITTHTDRVLLTKELFVKIIDEILNIDNWDIVETDPTEHWQEQSFNWAKAFDKFFEEQSNA